MQTKMMTLQCAAGHTWERPSQRGRPPRTCPEHTGAIQPDTGAIQSRVAAMRAGRERATAERADASRERVAAYSTWVKADAEASAQRMAGVRMQRPPMPEVPTDNDYRIARDDAD